MKQGKYESLTDYYKRFRTVLDILEHYGANVWTHPSLIANKFKKDGFTNITNDNVYDDINVFKKYLKTNKQRSIAFAFIKGAYRSRYGNLTQDLKSQYARGSNQYPVNLNEALKLLSTHEKREKEHGKNKTKKSDEEIEEMDGNDEKEEMVFVQNTTKKLPKCFLCGGTHYITTCPYKNQFKKARLDEERNPAPTNTANNMLIQDSNNTDDENRDENDDMDLYDFSFANIGTQIITKTQQIILSQKSRGKKMRQCVVTVTEVTRIHS